MSPSRVPPPTSEGPAWREIRGLWQPLHGSFSEQGLSLEWHEFQLDNDLDWARSFHAGSLEICVNYSGSAWIERDSIPQPIFGEQIAIYTSSKQLSRAVRQTGTFHRFLTIEISAQFLETQFPRILKRLKPSIRAFIANPESAEPTLEIQPLPSGLLATRVHFLNPPVPEGARETWYLGRVLEILAQTIFAPEDPTELFCKRYHRSTSERVERVCYLLERDLENPPTLEMLAEIVGLSTFHLSRSFAKDTGTSIPKYLRMKRIEKAAELLRGGKLNVTQAAMAVGYSSLSAFNKAFVEQMGCCPGLYPHAKISGRNTPTGPS